MNKTLVLGSVLAIMLSLLGPTVNAAVTSRVSATRGVAMQQVSDPVVIPLSLTSETPSVTLTSPSTGAVFASGARVAITATVVSSEFNRITAVDFYVGERFIGREEDPPYTQTWTATPGVHELWAVGRSSGGSGQVFSQDVRITVNTSASIDDGADTVPPAVTVPAPVAPPAGTTAPPTVTLTLPATLPDLLTAPFSLSLQATATAGTGRTIVKVDFYAGATLLGTDTTSPYALPWTAVAGTYVLTAKTTDSAGVIATSTAVPLLVTGALLPTVTTITLTNPASGATFTAPATIQLAATVTNPPAGAVVEFLNGSTVVGSDSSAPYAVTWTNVAAGNYSVTARLMATSATVSLQSQVVVGVSTPVPTGSLAALPLVYAPGLAYQGAFRLPAGQLGSSSFMYVWKGLAFNPARNSLFMGGHDNQQQVAEVGISNPGTSSDVASLAVAPLLQGFGDPTDGARALVGGAGDATKIGGLLVYKGELFSSAYIYYDAGGLQQVSHFRNGLDLTNKTDARGPFKVGSSIAGLVSGYMGLIPQAWQAALGGPALTGQCCLSIISRTSFGPAAFAFDPATLGTQATVAALPLVYYDANHTTLGPWANSSPLYGSTTEIGGVVFPEGTRSVLFFGVNGEGTHCYGDGTSQNPPPAGACYDPTTTDKGGHAYPYHYQVWAYDALDLAAVKAGTKQPWDVVPYAYWTLSLPQGAGMPRIAGAAYDPVTERIFLSTARGDQTSPVIHVFTVTK